MSSTKKSILVLTPFFHPNIGGVETHLLDLCQQLDQKSYSFTVLTFTPLSTNLKAKLRENFGHHGTIIRFSYIGHNLFHRLEKYPLLNFLYLSPYLFLRSFVYLLIHSKPDIIHSHGLAAAFTAFFLQKIFSFQKHIVSIYSNYDNVPLNNFYFKIFTWVLNHSQAVLTQSNQSLQKLSQLGVHQHLLHRYYHWIDLNTFKPSYRKNKKFTCLFVGRMIPAKNTLMVAKLARYFPQINFDFIGTGPDFNFLQLFATKYSNIHLLGDISYTDLPLYYSRSHLLLVPSKYQEGWGRIIAESIACATPVIASNLGATTEAANTDVAIFIRPILKNFSTHLQKLSKHQSLYHQMQKKCRPYALRHYSSRNATYIFKHYQ